MSSDIPSPPPCPPPVESRTTRHVPCKNYMVLVKDLMAHKVKDPALHEAAFHGRENELRRLLSNKNGTKCLNLRNHLGCTPLRLAASAGHADCLRVLLSHGASVDIVDIKAQTALAAAVKFKNTDCVRLLLEAGANPDGDVNNLSTPISWAVQLGHYDNVQLLLNFGCNVDGVHPQATNLCTFTPLHTTVTYGHRQLFMALLSAGAISPVSHDAHKCMYEIALQKYKSDLVWVQMLYDHGLPRSLNQDLEDIRTKLEASNVPNPAWILYQRLFSEPRTLLSLCRIGIRHHMTSMRTLREVNKLPLPTSLVRYILYQ